MTNLELATTQEADIIDIFTGQRPLGLDTAVGLSRQERIRRRNIDRLAEEYVAEAMGVSEEQPNGLLALREVGLYTEDSIGDLYNFAGSVPLLDREKEVTLAKLMDHGKEITATRQPDNESQRDKNLNDLSEAIGLTARTVFINSNLRLVIREVKQKYRGRDNDLRLDIIKEGIIGLMHGVDKFNWQKGYKFSTYGKNWIDQGIERAIITLGNMIRRPVHVGSSIAAVRKADETLTVSLGRKPNTDEIAEYVNEPVPTVMGILDVIAQDVKSLDAPIKVDSRSSRADYLEDQTAVIDAPLMQLDRAEAIERALAMLTPLQKNVTSDHHGLSGNRPMGIKALALKYGISDYSANKAIRDAHKILAESATELVQYID